MVAWGCRITYYPQKSIFMSAVNFRYVSAEAALQLPNSKGRRTSRVHLFDYHGIEGKDLYAIAGSKIHVPANKTPSLNCLQRRFYFLHNHEVDGVATWYRISKQSFCKRLEIKKRGWSQIVSGKGLTRPGFEEWLQRNRSLRSAHQWLSQASQLIDGYSRMAGCQRIVTVFPGAVMQHNPGERTSSKFNGLAARFASAFESAPTPCYIISRFPKNLFKVIVLHHNGIERLSLADPTIERLRRYLIDLNIPWTTELTNALFSRPLS
jgi:hypothetical protein